MSTSVVEPRRFGSGLAGDADTDQKPERISGPDLQPRNTRSRLAPGKPIKFGLAIGPVLLLVAWIIASATGVLDPKTLSEPWTVDHVTLFRSHLGRPAPRYEPLDRFSLDG